MVNCGQCKERYATLDEVVEHIKDTHPGVLRDDDFWPDGGLAVVHEEMSPEDFI